MATVFSLPPGFEGVAMGSLPAHHVPQTNKPKHARETKKVSWASEDILCQVRLFAAEDAPAESSIARQDLLQAKKTRFMHALNPIVPVDLPPGFGPSAPKRIRPVAAAIRPQFTWRTPEPFKLDPTWLVMAGKESQEVSAQRERENRILEAVYPRPTAIPESPAEPLETQLSYDDTMTLIIPVVPLEDDDLPEQDDDPTTAGGKAVSPPPGFGAMTKNPVKSRNWFPEASQDSGTLGVPRDSIVSLTTSLPGPPVSMSRNIPPLNSSNTLMGSVGSADRPHEAEPDVVAAAAAAYAALAQSNDETMIDRDLLIQFLTNPSMLQSLSDKLAAHPPAAGRSNESVDQHSGMGPLANGQPWNLPASEHMRGDVSAKGGHRHSETAAGATPGHGYDRPPGFGPGTFDVRPSNGLAQTSSGPPPQTGQGFPASSRPLNGESLVPSSIPPPPLSGAQPVESGSGRTLSQRDEQYYKDLISQHGRKNDEDYWGGGVSAMEIGNSYPSSGRARATSSDRHGRSDRSDRSERSERSERLDSGGRWSGREDVDFAGLSLRQGDGESRSGQSRGKSRKACIYFSTSRGCRNGSSCAFVHESNVAERAAKRPKLEGKESSKGYR